MTTPDAWEREPDESTQAYNAFLLYKGLEKGRSIDAAYLTHWRQTLPERTAKKLQSGGTNGATPPKRAPSNWFAWASQFNWPSRAKAWDDYIARKDAEKAEADLLKARGETRKKWLMAGDSAYAVGLAWTNAILNKAKEDGIESLSAGEAVQLLRVSKDLTSAALNMDDGPKRPEVADSISTTAGESTGGGRPARKTAEDELLDLLTHDPDLLRHVAGLDRPASD